MNNSDRDSSTVADRMSSKYEADKERYLLICKCINKRGFYRKINTCINVCVYVCMYSCMHMNLYMI
jgi:hypothetical protein